MRCTTEVHGRVDPMDDHGVISQAESDDEILAFDVSDEALERTASTEQQGSLGYIALGVGSTARLNSAQDGAQLQQLGDVHQNPPRLIRSCERSASLINFFQPIWPADHSRLRSSA